MPTAPPYERIVFDCDSTLSRIEGIELLAAARPEARDEIARLTDAAMAGEIALQDVYARRLELLMPKQREISAVAAAYVEHAVPKGRELVNVLHALGKEVRVVSGGLRLAVQPFALWLGVRDERCHAVQVRFDRFGNYLDHDRDSPLTRSGGKLELLRSLPPMRTVLIGDGMTDAETRPAIDTFICYAGVVRREAVVALADETVDVPHLAALLPLLCTPDELEWVRKSPRLAPILVDARRLE
ncbi:MAG: HAD-IB family phosphatase [Planctomycetes bacterium]|nr:HAD-IB family phosphatase [Planctomycetota bacterium]